MCGRFTLTASARVVETVFDVRDVEPFPPRTAIAPTQPILVILNDPSRGREDRRALLVRWGLIPAFAKDPADIPLLFNARSETAAERPAFRGAMRHRRCLVPATGFYEWRKVGTGRSEPFLIRPASDGGLVALAGLMETFMAADGSEIDTATILTTDANTTLAAIHPRMPVIVEPRDFARWLDCRANEPSAVADLLAAAPDAMLEAVPVEAAVARPVPMRLVGARPADGTRGQGSFDF